jgi:magnesium transporter
MPILLQAVITTKFILVVNPEESSSLKFISTLKERLAHPYLTMGRSFQSLTDLPRAAASGAMPLRLDMDLPFELRALEICLDEVNCSAIGT